MERGRKITTLKKKIPSVRNLTKYISKNAVDHGDYPINLWGVNVKEGDLVNDESSWHIRFISYSLTLELV